MKKIFNTKIYNCKNGFRNIKAVGKIKKIGISGYSISGTIDNNSVSFEQISGQHIIELDTNLNHEIDINLKCLPNKSTYLILYIETDRKEKVNNSNVRISRLNSKRRKTSFIR